MNDDLFGEVIHAYSRAEAIADGVLVPVTGEAAGLFKFPAAITASLDADCRAGQGSDPATYAARVWDVFYMLSVAIRAKAPEATPGGSSVEFTVRIGKRSLKLLGHLGPGDGPEPVLTVGFPSDF